MGEVHLMKGNEALAEAAIRTGVDAYFGYPITPQSEILEYLMNEEPYKRTGMAVLQAESEVAAINMVYGAAACGKKALTSSSGPGISLKAEGISYIAGAELPCLIVNVVRGGPGLGTIQPSQSDYFQTVKGGGHGDFKLITLAPATVQEMADFVDLGFELAFKYRTPAFILSDGVIGQMMEKVTFDPQQERLSDEKVEELYGAWATLGKKKSKRRNTITSLALKPEIQEEHNHHLQRKYAEITKNEVRFEKFDCEDAEYLIVAYGASARISQKALKIAKAKGMKVGLLRPITLWPFPSDAISEMADQVKGVLSVEMSAGQMVEDVRLAVNGKVQVEHFGRYGGMIHSPNEVCDAIVEKLINN